MKSYRFLGEEAEALGKRLDSARNSLTGAKSAWAINYWTQTVERLLFQWRQLPVLHDAEAQVTIIPKWTVSYDFYESNNLTEGNGVTDRVYHKFFRESIDIEASWHSHRESRLARAQY
jgi:hypothetical protein